MKTPYQIVFNRLKAFEDEHAECDVCRKAYNDKIKEGVTATCTQCNVIIVILRRKSHE